MSKRIRGGWSSNMEQRAGLEGRQVKCLIASEGHLWMRGYSTGFRQPCGAAWPRAPSMSVRLAWTLRPA